jgi:hypothetical protein
VGAGVLSEMVVSGGCRGKVAYAYQVVDGLPHRSPQSPIRLVPVNLSYNCFKRPYGWSLESRGRCGQGKTGVGRGLATHVRVSEGTWWEEKNLEEKVLSWATRRTRMHVVLLEHGVGWMCIIICESTNVTVRVRRVCQRIYKVL